MNGGASTRELERRLAAAPSSPLFARLASGLLSHGEVARAEALCERGVKLFPRYATGRLVYARCLAARGLVGDAVRTLETVVSGYPGNLVLVDLEENWRNRLAAEPETVVPGDDAVFTVLPSDERVSSAPTETVDAVEAVETADTVEPESGVDEMIEVIGAAAEPIEAQMPPAQPAGFPDGALADQDSMDGFTVEPPAPVPTKHAGIVPILQPVPPPMYRMSFIERDRIVSRTLAEIYASQGAITEAVVTYRLLLERMPERSEQMEERLKELEDRMRTDPGPRPGAVE
jgi:hypothetical protein